jgi:hypothetical protein
VIEGADHGLSRESWKQAYTEVLTRWIAEMIAAPPAEVLRRAAAVGAPAPRES